MLFQSLIAPLLFGAATAQHVHFQPPEVQFYVQSIRSHFQAWPNYHGPTPVPHKPFPKPPKPTPTAGCGTFWMQNIKHQGVAAFNPSPSTYQVFRNVRDFGAVGDGVTDDTAAINNAISSGGRCGPGCASSTVTPAVVYFPAGTYLISSSIIDYYYTQLIGDANCPPTLLANATFSGFGLIDGDPYGANGLAWGATNVFFRQVRNFVLDMTAIPGSSAATGIHWPTAQATSLQNVVFKMNSDAGTQHQGLFIEEGSGGFMNDLVFYGGLYGMNVGNQQFTMRNISFYGAVTAINQLWDWGWTYKSVNINNCSVGLNISSGAPNALSVGSITFFDSSISNTPVGIITGRTVNSAPPAANSLIIENVAFNNVPVAVQAIGGATVLAGSTGSVTVAAWGQGHAYTPTGPTTFQGPIPPNPRPGSLLSGRKFYERSKPQYEKEPLSSFLSVRSFGAKGDGRNDDTRSLQNAIVAAAAQRKILFVDHGDYIVTSTIYIPSGSRIVGESYSVILSSGSFFADISRPQPVVQVGKPGERGNIEWSDMIVSTQGPAAGAILIEYNLASFGTPAGMWDVHARIGGFAGSNLQLAQCPAISDIPAPIPTDCIAAYLTMHITKWASGLYMENNWLWTADHDIEDPQLRQITIFAGRGLYVESNAGTIWLVGTAVEHHVKYEYQFANTQNIFMGQIQTETAYYQPNPNATVPFPTDRSLNDPVFPTGPAVGNSTNTSEGWGLRVINSDNILVYGAGLYSFFDNYSTNCSAQGNGEVCQTRIFSVEGSRRSSVYVYNLNTVGTTEMITQDGRDLAYFADNLNGFVDTIALYRSG